jgi:hypothetical protein
VDEFGDLTVDNLAGNERRLARRVMIATLLMLVFSTALFVSRPYFLTRPQPDDATPGKDHAAALAQFAPLARLHAADPSDHQPAHPHPRTRAHRLALAQNWPDPGGLRQRLVGATGPAPNNDLAIDLPAPDAELFAMGAPQPHLFGADDLGLLYRFSAERRYLLPQRGLALNDRLPLIFAQNNAVPEPGTWMTMILGLMLAGALLRARAAWAPRPAIADEPAL